MFARLNTHILQVGRNRYDSRGCELAVDLTRLQHRYLRRMRSAISNIEDIQCCRCHDQLVPVVQNGRAGSNVHQRLRARRALAAGNDSLTSFSTWKCPLWGGNELRKRRVAVARRAMVALEQLRLRSPPHGEKQNGVNEEALECRMPLCRGLIMFLDAKVESW